MSELVTVERMRVIVTALSEQLAHAQGLLDAAEVKAGGRTACRFNGASSLLRNPRVQAKGMSELGALAADILGDVFRGLHHMTMAELDAVEWENENHIEVRTSRTLDSFDGDELTRLVILAHDRAVRVQVSAVVEWYMLMDPNDTDSAVRVEHEYGQDHGGREVYPQQKLEIMFHTRQREATGPWGFASRHPSMEQAVKSLRASSGTMGWLERREAWRAQSEKREEAKLEAFRAVLS